MNLTNMPLKNRPYFHKDFWAPPANFGPGLAKQLRVPKPLYIHDVTLRDGEQTPGVAFTIDEKVMLAKELEKAGVQSIEIGLPVIPKDFEAMRILCSEKRKSRMVCLVRAIKGDIDKAVEAGIRHVVLEHSVNPYSCKLAYDMSEKDLIKKNVEMIRYAKDRGLWVNWMGWDTFRQSEAFIERVFKAVVRDGDPEAITLADTFGMMHPLATHAFFKKLRKWFPRKLIEYHAHNDMGMTTANAVCAVTGGANAVHTAVNGLGERAGNISLEEFSTAISGCLGVNTGVKLPRLCRLSKMVEQFSRVTVADGKPIVGRKLFTVESGLIMHILMKAKAKGFPAIIMQPFLPKMVGQNEMEFVVGKGAGKATILYFLKKLGLKVKPERIAKLIGLVKNEATMRKSCLTEDEFKQGVKSL